jgi:type II secretory pathway component PulF
MFSKKKSRRRKGGEGEFAISRPRRGSGSAFKCWWVKNFSFGTKQRVEYYRVLKALTGNGVSVQASLKLYSQMIAKHDKSKKTLKFIIDDVLKMMSQGVRYEQAISVWVPLEECVLIQASSKDVAKACAIITSFTENILEIKGALSSALTYPVMMLLVLVGCLAAFAFYIMPSMIQLSSPTRWPSEAQALYHVSNFIINHTVAIVFWLVAFFTFTTWSMQNLTFMPARVILDKIPPWSIFKSFTSTTFLIALASLLRSGTSYNQALKDIRKTSSPYLRRYLDKILKRLSAGNAFGDSLEVGLFEGEILISLTVFAMTNRLEQGIQFLANENQEEQRLMFINKGKVLGYIMMVLVAGTIGWVMLSLYGMQSTIQG